MAFILDFLHNFSHMRGLFIKCSNCIFILSTLGSIYSQISFAISEQTHMFVVKIVDSHDIPSNIEREPLSDIDGRQ